MHIHPHTCVRGLLACISVSGYRAEHTLWMQHNDMCVETVGACQTHAGGICIALHISVPTICASRRQSIQTTDCQPSTQQQHQPNNHNTNTASSFFQLLATTMAVTDTVAPPVQMDDKQADLASVPRVHSAGDLHALQRTEPPRGKPPRPRSSNNLAALAEVMAPPRPREPGRANTHRLFNTLIKLIEAHLPAAQQHKLHELKQVIAKLKAKRDRAGLHAPLDAFFALVYQWAPREQWLELQHCANQAGVRLQVDGQGNVHIRKRGAAHAPPAMKATQTDLRVEMLKQQATRASLADVPQRA